MAEFRLDNLLQQARQLGLGLEKLIVAKSETNSSLGAAVLSSNVPVHQEISDLKSLAVSKQRELQQVAPLFGDRSTIKRALELNKIHQNALDLQKAMRMGIVDIEEGEAQLKKFRHEMNLAELKAHGDSILGLSEEQTTGKEGTNLATKLSAGGAEGLSSVVTKAASVVGGEFGGIAEGLMGLSSALPIAGGLFALLLYGVKEHDRLQQQAGQMSNLFSAYSASAYANSIAWLDGFQERAQKFYGISRSAVMGVVSQYLNAGTSVSELFATYDSTLGEVGQNIVTLSLAVDRAYELSNGFTGKGVISLVKGHGMSIGDAAHKMTLMTNAVAKSGLGVERTITWALQAGQNVRRFGVDAQQWVEASLAFSHSRKNRGLAPQTGVAQGMSEAAQGLGSMNMARELWMAEQLGYGKGLLGRYAMRDMFSHMDNKRLLEIARIFRDEALLAGGDEQNSRHYLERLGFGFEGAKVIYELGGLSESDVKLTELDTQSLGMLRSAFADEGSKVSENQRKLNGILADMRTVAQTSLNILSDAVAFVIVGIESLPSLLTGGQSARKRAYDEFNRITNDLTANAGLFWIGLKGVGSGIWGMLEPHVRPVVKALTFDPKTALAKRDAAIQAASADEQHAAKISRWQNPVVRPVADATLFGLKTVNTGLKAVGVDPNTIDDRVSDERIKQTEDTRDQADSKKPDKHSFAAPIIRQRMHPGADTADAVTVKVTVAYG